MRQIEAFDILTKSIQKYLHAAQLNGSRNNALLIIAPCDPLNLQPLISEFDQLQNSTPRLEKLFERTGEILDAWNTFVQLPKDGESLCYRIDESYKIWLKSAGIDPEQWSEGSDYLIYTWDGTAHIINEVNGYLRQKIGAKKSTASATDKRTANRPKAEPKSVIDLISEAKIEKCFKQKFIDLLKAEFIDSTPKVFSLMVKAMKQEGILIPSDNIVYYKAFEAYFGKEYGSTEAKNKPMRAKNDKDVLLGYKTQIGNIINKSKTI